MKHFSNTLDRYGWLAAVTLTVGLTLMFVQAVHAQGYPDKPIRLLVPFPLGGGSHKVARTLTKKLEELMKVSFVVENKGGANGSIALDALAKSPADGYTLALTLTDHIALNPALFEKLPYDPMKDFAHVALITSYPFVYSVDAGAAPATMAQAIAAAKASPGSTPIGFPSANARIGIEQLQRRAGVELTVVPYRGFGQGMPDLLGGRITFWIGTSATMRGYIDGGKVRGLAVTSSKRLSAMPDIPTIAELGYPGYETVSWYGLLAPAKTPKAIVAKLNAQVNAALQSPEVPAAFEADGATLLGGTPEKFTETLRSDIKTLGVLAKTLGLKVA